MEEERERMRNLLGSEGILGKSMFEWRVKRGRERGLRKSLVTIIALGC